MRSETRLLTLLGLFASRRIFTAAELAARFDVTPRTIRRDIAELRGLGYIISSDPGVAGGYRAESRTVLPPLQLEAGEALATAVGLALLRGAGLDTEHADSATTKLQAMLPAEMHAAVADIATAVSVSEGHAPGVDISAVITLAAAINASTIATFDYRKMRYPDAESTADRGPGAAAQSSSRRVEPVRLVVFGAHWYLFAFDLDRADHRVFRLDRMSLVHATTLTITPREHPDAEAAVSAAVTTASYPHNVVLRTAATAQEAKEWFSTRTATITEEAGSVRITFGFDDLRWVAATLASLPAEFEILDPPELIDAMERLAARAASVVAASTPHHPRSLLPDGGAATSRQVAAPPSGSN